MNSGNMSSRLDSSSDEEEDYPIYSRVAEALAANRLKVARENAARRLNREVGATTTRDDSANMVYFLKLSSSLLLLKFEIDELIKEAMQNIFKLKFVFQKRPAVVLYVDKTAEFSAVIGELCDRLRADSSKFAVFFDGQRICETDTPFSLGMENGDVVDVIFKN
ncbi:hypothetical protein D918_04307 [Trichuris suis]|nr:hypothetical protein D918_04307 [Trichuris suis]